MGTIATNLGVELRALELPRSFILGGYIFEKTNVYPLPVALEGDYTSFFAVGGFRYSVFGGQVLNADRANIRHFSVVVDDKLELFVGTAYTFGDTQNMAVVPDLGYTSGYVAVKFVNGIEPDTLLDTLSDGYTLTTGIAGTSVSVAYSELDSNNLLLNLVYKDSVGNRYIFVGYATYDTDRTLTRVLNTGGYLCDVPIRYLGKINGVYYFAGFFLVDGAVKLGIASFDSTQKSGTINYYDLSDTPEVDQFVPAISGVYREDGSIYLPVLYRTSSGWNADVFLINATDGSVGNIGWTFDTSEVDISTFVPASGSYGWASDVSLASGKGMLVHSLYLDKYSAPPTYGNTFDFVFTLYLDETNGKLVVKDAKSYKASLARGVLPLNQGKDSFYVLGDSYISLLKINGDGVAVYEDVHRAVDILGVDELGRIWGADSLSVELLPIYEPYRRLELEFSTPLSVSDTYPISNSIVVKLYDENGNRIAGTVELVVTSGNMLFTDNNSYKITVDVSDGTNGDTTVGVSITAAGDINVEGVIL